MNRWKAGATFVTTLALQSAFGIGESPFGAAPESLDLSSLELPKAAGPAVSAPSVAAGSSATASPSEPATRRHPFTRVKAPDSDPQNGKVAGQVVVGAPLAMPAGAGGFDTYRFVTYLDLESRKERLFELPVHHQDCTLAAKAFADYNYTATLETSVSSAVNGEWLGLPAATQDRVRPFRVRESVKSTPRIVADYTPSVVKKSARGRTFIQLFNSSTGEARMVVTANESGLDLERWFPKYFGGQEIYPLPIEIQNLAWTFVVDKTEVRKCSTAELRGVERTAI